MFFVTACRWQRLAPSPPPAPGERPEPVGSHCKQAWFKIKLSFIYFKIICQISSFHLNSCSWKHSWTEPLCWQTRSTTTSQDSSSPSSSGGGSSSSSSAHSCCRWPSVQLRHSSMTHLAYDAVLTPNCRK